MGYRVYASYFSDSPSFDQENKIPFKDNFITWTAPTGEKQVYLLYTTTVDAQGRESSPSNRIVVDLR